MSATAMNAGTEIRRVAAILGSLTALIGAVVLVGGWWIGINALTQPIPGASSMKANTAVGLVLAGIAVYLVARRTAPVVSAIVSVVLALLGSATLLEYLFFNSGIGIDELLAADPGGPGTITPGRMGLNTAFCFAVLGIGLLLLSIDRLARTGQLAAALVWVIAYVAVLGYLMDTDFLAGTRSDWTQMAIHTSFALLLASSGAILARPSIGIGDILTDEAAGGRQARILIPTIIGISLALSLIIRFTRALEVPAPIPAALVLAAFTIAALSAIIFAAFSASELDRKRLANEALAIALDNSPDSILVVGEDGKVLLANETAADLALRNPEQLEGMYVDQLVSPHVDETGATESQPVVTAPYSVDHVSTTLRTDRTYDFHRSNGRVVPVDLELRSAQIASDTVATVVSIRDISEVLRVNRELKQFAYVASHDLRAPLRSISGFSELLRETLDQSQLSEEAVDYLAEIQSGTDRMNALIAALLEYSSLDQSQFVGESSSVAGLIDSTVASVSADPTQTDTTFRVAVEPSLVWSVDDALMRTALTNLLTNSVKYRRPDVALEVDITAELNEQGEAVLTVLDNGQGIAPDHLDRATSMFQRLTTVGEGLGIGLATVDKIVDLHSGSMTIDSDGQTFTAITITIPPASVQQSKKGRHHDLRR